MVGILTSDPEGHRVGGRGPQRQRYTALWIIYDTGLGHLYTTHSIPHLRTRHDGLQSKTVPSHTSIGGREKGRGGLIPVSDRSLSLEGTSGRGLRCDPDAPKVGPQRLSVWVAISLFWNELAVTSMYIAVIAAGGSRKVARGIIM